MCLARCKYIQSRSTKQNASVSVQMTNDWCAQGLTVVSVSKVLCGQYEVTWFLLFYITI